MSLVRSLGSGASDTSRATGRTSGKAKTRTSVSFFPLRLSCRSKRWRPTAKDLGLPFSRLTRTEIARCAVERGIVASISGATVWRGSARMLSALVLWIVFGDVFRVAREIRALAEAVLGAPGPPQNMSPYFVHVLSVIAVGMATRSRFEVKAGVVLDLYHRLWTVFTASG